MFQAENRWLLKWIALCLFLIGIGVFVLWLYFASGVFRPAAENAAQIKLTLRQ